MVLKNNWSFSIGYTLFKLKNKKGVWQLNQKQERL